MIKTDEIDTAAVRAYVRDTLRVETASAYLLALCDALDAARIELINLAATAVQLTWRAEKAEEQVARVRAMATDYANGATTSSSQEAIGRRFLTALDGET